VACSGSSTSNSGASGLAIPPNNIVSRTADPVGDTIASGGTTWDITEIQTTLVEGPFRNEYVTLQVAVSFAQDVSNALPAPGQDLVNHQNALGVEILLNIDGNTGTGIPESACSSTPNIPGVDAAVDAGGYSGRSANGSYPILDTRGLKKDEAPISISGHTITYSIDLAAWGVPATGIQKTTISVIAVNGSGPGGSSTTDCAPNAGPMSVSGT
jgi:hypothetical protein